MESDRLPMETGMPNSNEVFCMIFSVNMLNSARDNGLVRRTPTVFRKKSPTFLFSTTALVASLWNWWLHDEVLEGQMKPKHSASIKLLDLRGITTRDSRSASND